MWWQGHHPLNSKIIDDGCMHTTIISCSLEVKHRVHGSSNFATACHAIHGSIVVMALHVLPALQTTKEMAAIAGQLLSAMSGIPVLVTSLCFMNL